MHRSITASQGRGEAAAVQPSRGQLAIKWPEASKALTRTPPDCLGDTSVPGDRTHDQLAVGEPKWVRTPPVRLRRGHFAASRPGHSTRYSRITSASR